MSVCPADSKNGVTKVLSDYTLLGITKKEYQYYIFLNPLGKIKMHVSVSWWFWYFILPLKPKSKEAKLIFHV